MKSFRAAPVLLQTPGLSLPLNSRERLYPSDAPRVRLGKALRLSGALRIFTIAILLCCARTVPAWSQPTGAPSFYPLGMGDYWVYLDFGMMSFPDTLTIDAYGDTLIEGQQWIKLHRWSHRYENHGYYVERVDPTGDVLGRSAGGTYLKWRLSDTSATFWQATGGFMARFDSCVAGEYLGVRGHILYVNYWAPGDTAAREVDAFGEGVGWLHRGPYGCCIDGLPAYLAGARIDGKVYGVLGGGHQPLPLQVGNFWEYRSVDPFDPSRFRMTVVGDTTMPNGRTYSVLDGSIFTSKYLRTEGSSVFAYGAEDSIEYTQFDGNALVGDTMAFLGHPMQGGIVLCASTLDTNWKSWIWQFVYYWGTPEGWYEGVDWLVQDSVGVVRMMVEPGNAYSLQGARIGGDTIGTVVSVEERVGAAAEDPYLSQNYPNPFNAITKLVYGLPEDTHVSVEVFDVLGQRVATLFDGEQRSGAYQVVFDADGLSSGPYICRLRAGSFMRARTLMLLR